MSEAGVQVERLARIIKAMDDELSASQAREAELREKLEAAEAHCAEMADVALRNGAALLAAEARIKASQEQKPRAYETEWEGSRSLSFAHPKIGAISFPLYKQPIIPPELAELQREIETLQSALTAKVTVCGDEQIGALKRENAELRNLLEESKVPEGWQLVPAEPSQAMIDAGDPAFDHGYVADAYKAMLNSAPQPKEPKQ